MTHVRAFSDLPGCTPLTSMHTRAHDAPTNALTTHNFLSFTRLFMKIPSSRRTLRLSA